MYACKHLRVWLHGCCCFFSICSHASIMQLCTHFITTEIHCLDFQIRLYLPRAYCVFVGFRYPPSSRQTSHEEGKEWLRSHSTGGLQDTGSQSPLSPPGASCTNTGKYHYSNLHLGVFALRAVSPTNISQYNLPPGSTSMSRSNSIPAHDSFDLYGEGHPLGGSATSLEDRPRGISRSGSFRDSTDEVHGSSLSLVSSTSSLYSATEEKAHSEQIRKLRRELDASQEKVATLTSQLSTNVSLFTSEHAVRTAGSFA
ncbi:neuron navigator 3-like isoform X2 [Anarrhichthys ocellatus]|uniref:neuron navigator 3-like isoform X2 n=1 Tax=Anarrhichthys ocellatus TaxID=433405 RepID=UPI0012EE0919|nr:neuron navigator 3-like isoform X2 [Anarrhichthys ocellatus]XP_031695131.1 neuron navigator 3-like isoform X2 [Anarrhichthys ocellatus]